MSDVDKLNKALEDHAASLIKQESSEDQPGKVMSGLAGALSGVTGGISGNWGPLADYSTRAQTANPVSYGLGYAGGTAATLPFGGAVLKGAVTGAGKAATMGRAALEGTADVAANATKAMPKVSEFLAARGREQATADALRAGVVRPGMQVPEKAAAMITSKPSQAAAQVIPRVGTALTGPDPVVKPPAAAAGAPQRTSDAGPYSRLMDYLKMSEGANPEAVQLAQIAAEGSADNDPVQKRKIAMQLSSTPNGRSLTNTDSDLRQG